jgi:hypothetical protein
MQQEQAAVQWVVMTRPMMQEQEQQAAATAPMTQVEEPGQLPTVMVPPRALSMASNPTNQARMLLLELLPLLPMQTTQSPRQGVETSHLLQGVQLPAPCC